jgi:hypothetical protein
LIGLTSSVRDNAEQSVVLRGGYGRKTSQEAGRASVALVLRAVDVASPWRWRWLLSDEESDRRLADHGVELDPACDEVAAFGDLHEYVREHASPDHPDEDAARIVARAGVWAGGVLLGRQSARR